MNKPTFSLLLAAALLTACATEPPFEGTPNVYIWATPVQVASHLSQHCVQGRGRIVAQGPYYFVCAVPMDGSMNSLIVRALVTENYSSNPEFNVQPSWAVEGNGVRVSSVSWMEHQNAFGKTTKNYLDQPTSKRSLQTGLEKMKATLEAQNAVR